MIAILQREAAMSTKTSTGRVRQVYEFIEQHRNEYSVQVMCNVLGVAPRGYYEWLQRPISDGAREDARLLRLMRENNVRALHGYRTRRIAAGRPSVPIPNLLQRQFTVTRPNQVWVTDMTCVRTWQGQLYLADVMALFPRRVVGWAASATIHRDLVLDAVLKAVKQRIKKHIYKNRELAVTDIADDIGSFYNASRRHRHLGGVSPDQFEAMSTRRRHGLH